MNIHKKVFFTAAVALGLAAGAFASSHVAPATKPVGEIQLPSIEIVGHRADSAVIALEPITIVASHAAVLAAADTAAKVAAQG